MAETASAADVGPVQESLLVDEAVDLARDLLEQSMGAATRRERRQHDRLANLIEDPIGRDLVFALTDEVLRIPDDQRAADRFAAIVAAHSGAPLGWIDRSLLVVGSRVGRWIPRLVMPLVRRRIEAETRGIVIPAEERPLRRHLERRHADGVDLNINPLGEAILSDHDARRRVERVLAHIARVDVDYVSVKITALVANLDVIAFEWSIDRICTRLRQIYRAAEAAQPRTFVNLDMEEYADLELSLVAFMRVLDEPEFLSIDAGIVLQAYLPDSHDALDRLGSWACARRHRGGGRIKIRLVKGANLAMERVEAELHNWTAAPYATKGDVDASYKAMLDRALSSEWADALRIGVASHNLFDVAWAFVVAGRAGALGRVEFEMLEGMAPAQARAVHERAGQLLMYAPVVDHDDFDASIAYLARRLDENTQPENFLRALFALRPGTPAWDEQERRFRTAVANRRDVSMTRRRGPAVRRGGEVTGDGLRFANEPDTDFTVAADRDAAFGTPCPDPAPSKVFDTGHIDHMIDRAAAAYRRWSAHRVDERRVAIERAAEEMRRSRFETLAVMAAETGKTAREADPEISEAIDFAMYYSGPGRELLDELAAAEPSVDVDGRGVIAVVGPWNFPYAIPAGGVFAALAAGNAVLLKPAPESVSVAALLVEQLHRSGLDPDLVQLVVCEDGPIGRHLVTHAGVDTVILTGSHETARTFLDWEPELRLFAETSGKNSLVITATADLDLAIDDLVTSAFGHAGQKCSAASLGIVEASVYDDIEFRTRVRDVVLSRRVGWPHDPATIVGPLITPPNDKLERALTSLEPGESWLVAPERLDDTGRLWRPGVRLDVQPGSWFHRTECFGPVLGLIRADDLDHAIAIQNDSDYGLTGGIHSLDDAEIDRWRAGVAVGNVYVNRQITGAVVQRQPFGGWKRSSVGAGTKAGGPNYLLQFARITDGGPPPPAPLVERSYASAWREQFSVEHDPSGLASESNVLRYVTVPRVVVRHDGSDPVALVRFVAASRVTGVELVVFDRSSCPDAAFLAVLRADDRVRLVGDVGEIRRELVERNIWHDGSAPSANGRVELVKWVREQAISRTRHRHGRVARAVDPSDPRQPVAVTRNRRP